MKFTAKYVSWFRPSYSRFPEGSSIEISCDGGKTWEKIGKIKNYFFRKRTKPKFYFLPTFSNGKKIQFDFVPCSTIFGEKHDNKKDNSLFFPDGVGE